MRARLVDHFTLQRGTTYQSRLLGEPGPVLLGLASIKRNGGFRTDSLRTYGGDSPDKLLVRPGELYVSLKDVTQSGDLLGAVARMPREHPVGRLTQDTVKLEPRSVDVPLDYLYWLLRTPQYRNYCRAHATGTTNLGLPREDFLAFPAPDPNPMQLRIVETLETLDDKIELNRRLSETLEEMARALFRSWFVDFDPVRAKAEGRPSGLPPDLDALFPASFEASELGEIPAGWEVTTLGDVIDVNPKRSIRKGDVATHVEMAALPTSGPHVAAWTQRAFTSGSRFIRGDTLLARITPSLENGKTAFVDFLEEGETAWGSTEFTVLRPKEPWPPEMAYVMAREPNFREHAIVNMTGTSGRQRVPAEAVSSYPLAVASDGIAAAFGELARPLFERATRLAAQSRDLAEQRDALLPQLVSGELRVRAGEHAA